MKDDESSALSIHLLRSSQLLRPSAPRWQFGVESPQLPARQSLLYGYDVEPSGGHLVHGRYSKDALKLTTELGDIRLDSTQNTLQGLPRKGGKLAVHYNGVVLSTFAATKNKSLTAAEGARDGKATNEYIVGAAGEVSLLNNGVHVKTMYMSSGENRRSLNNPGEEEGSSGDVIAFITRIDPFEQKLVAETEVDFSEFSDDRGAPAERDRALRVKVGGLSGIYTYEAIYEYVGPEYQIMRREGPMRDREGLSLKSGVSLRNHALTGTVSRHNDNIRKDQDQPRYYTYQGGVNYLYRRFAMLPITLSYQKSFLDGEQNGSSETIRKTETDAITFRLNYLAGPWSLMASSKFFLENDLVGASGSSSSTTYTLAPSYLSGSLSASPSVSFNRYRFAPTGVTTDTYTMNMGMKSDKLISPRIACEANATIKSQRASDDSVKHDTYGGNLGVRYLLKKLFLGIDKPAVGLQASYNRKNNWRSGLGQDDFLIMFVFSSL